MTDGLAVVVCLPCRSERWAEEERQDAASASIGTAMNTLLVYFGSIFLENVFSFLCTFAAALIFLILCLKTTFIIPL